MAGDYDDNRPRCVRCVHPLVTLLEKLDAMIRRYDREPIEAASFVRHYEDAAQIILSIDRLPRVEQTVAELAQEMVETKDLRVLPTPNEPALRLVDADKRQALALAHAQIAPMFWGERISLARPSHRFRYETP